MLEEVGPQSATLKFLQDEGLWEPASLHDLRSRTVDKLIAEAGSLPKKRNVKGASESKPPSRLGWVYNEKLPTGLQSALVEQGVLARAESGFSGDPTLVDAVLRMCGRELAADRSHDGWYLDVPDDLQAQVSLTPTDDLGEPADEGNASVEVAVLMELQDAVPTLAPGTQLLDVIEFRKTHEVEFDAFMAGLAQLASSEAPDADVADMYVEALSALSSAAGSCGVDLQLRTRLFAKRVRGQLSEFHHLASKRPGDAAVLTTLSAMDVIGTVGGVASADQGALAGAGMLAAWKVVQVRRNSPSAFLRKAQAKGLIVRS